MSIFTTTKSKLNRVTLWQQPVDCCTSSAVDANPMCCIEKRLHDMQINTGNGVMSPGSAFPNRREFFVIGIFPFK